MEAPQPGLEAFRLFSSSSSDDKPQLGFGFFDSPQIPLPPLPPCLEILPSEYASISDKHYVESVNLDGLTLLKGRVSTHDVFSLSNSDLVPGKYEGGLKLWEGSLDLVKTLRSEVENGSLTFSGKKVLELGCGHGLPGIFACLEGAAVTHFQDFNAEVLEHLTIPNVNSNIRNKTQTLTSAEIRYFAGDWSEIHKVLPFVQDENQAYGDYDIILMAETVYSISTLPVLYDLIKKCTSHPHGVVYMSAKKHYFGVGGGSRRFVSLVEKDGVMTASLLAEVADGTSNVRELWKLQFK